MGGGIGGLVGSVAGGLAGGPLGAVAGGLAGGLLDGGSEAENMALANAKKAAKYAEKNVALAEDFDKFLATKGEEGISYAQGLLDDWEQAFGGVESNLSDYFNNLDPTKYSQQQKTAFSENLDKQMTQYRETLAQRGIQSSGMRMQAEKEAMFSKATANAGFDIAATDQVASMKMGWYNAGLPQKTLATNNMIDAMGRQVEYGTLGHNARANANTGIANALNGQGSNLAAISTNQRADMASMAQTGGMIAAGINDAGGLSGLWDKFTGTGAAGLGLTTGNAQALGAF